MRKIVQAMVFATASLLVVSPVAAESDMVGGKSGKTILPTLETELIAEESNSKTEPALTYTVLPGDNLYRIALAHEVEVHALVQWNALEGELIHPGQELNVSIETPGSSTNLKRAKEFAVAQAAQKQIVQGPAASGKSVNQKKSQTTAASASEETKTASTEPASTPAAPPSGNELTMTATAYTAYCTGCSGTTRTGIDLRANPNQKVIAVDPSVIPLGSRVWVEGYGEAIAGDTGGAIKGHKIDVFLPGQSNALAWGVKTVKVKVLN